MKKKEILLKASLPTSKFNPVGKKEHDFLEEYLRITKSGFAGFLYFVVNFVKIYDNSLAKWSFFDLWDGDMSPYSNQVDVAHLFYSEKRVVLPKARQVGITWIALSYCLFMALFFPEQKILLLSKGETEAKALMKRVKDMISKLPQFLQTEKESSLADNVMQLDLSNGSSIHSLPTTGGDSMTFTICVVDEADLIYRGATTLSQVLLNIEPTIGIKGKLFLVSKLDKARPDSTFKKLCRSAEENKDSLYKLGFVPWMVSPERTPDWHELQVKASLDIDGTKDTVHESYPATLQEAMQGKTKSKLYPIDKVEKCYQATPPLPVSLIDNSLISLNAYGDLRVYDRYVKNETYVLCVDPAGGLAHSDNTVLDLWRVSGAEISQVLVLSGKIHPAIAAIAADTISEAYGNCPIFPERNNHGFAFIGSMEDHYPNRKMLEDHTGQMGYYATKQGKAIGCGRLSTKLMTKKIRIRDKTTRREMLSVNDGTFSAPVGMLDDHATTAYLAAVSERYMPKSVEMETIKV